MKESFQNECAIIQQNCTYTAETHHLMAAKSKKHSTWLEVIPAIIAALTSTLVAAGIAGEWLLPFTIISATISAITAVLSPNRVYQEHLSAARSFTTLKHDARFLRETQYVKMSEDAFAVSVEHLHNKYNDLLKSVLPTDDKIFEIARKKIQSGVHEPDRDSDGKIK